jgi:hypothetical protein
MLVTNRSRIAITSWVERSRSASVSSILMEVILKGTSGWPCMATMPKPRVCASKITAHFLSLHVKRAEVDH